MNDKKKLTTKLEEIEKSFKNMAVDFRDNQPSLSYLMFRVSQTCGEAARELKEQEPVQAEMEGGGSTWWYVCGQCHTAIDTKDKYCKECGRRIIWK